MKMANKTRNMVNDAHCKAAKWLTDEYDHILIPYSRISSMVMRGIDRKIGRDSVRQLLGWQHYRFRVRLIGKGRTTGCRVHQVSEDYTTKTCSRCGTFWHGIGASKVFRCQNAECGFECDRDFNAARNIMQMNAMDCLGRLEPLTQ
jgi:putative transposase